jgi:hypothetical protein
MTIVNLTPHAINIVAADGTITTFAPSGTVARVAATSVVVGDVGGFPIFAQKMGEVVGLPDATPVTTFIVSGMVAAAVRRADVLSPGDLVRDAANAVIGCRGFIRH